MTNVGIEAGHRPHTVPSVLQCPDGVVRAMRSSVHHFGFGALDRSLRGPVLNALRAEAGSLLEAASHAASESGLRYSARIAGLGEVALSLLKGPELSGLLEEVFGRAFTLSEEISCFTFYGAQDHLGAHQDKPGDRCVVTIIVYLHAVSPVPDAPDTGLVLNVYGETEDSVGDTRLSIPTVAGTLVLGNGSRVWHERPRLKDGEEVIAITGCYRPAAEGA